MVALVVQLSSDYCTFAGFGGWGVGVVHCISCGPVDDFALSSNCGIHHQHQSASRVSACGGKGGYSLRVIACN